MTSDNSFSPARNHRKFMNRALKLGKQAYNEDEVPIGAVIVYDNTIIGKGYNQVEKLRDSTAHAEMLAISAACSSLQSKYLMNCTLYVTLEPCPMCATALVWSKIERIVFGATDADYGACGSVFNLTNNSNLNHDVEIIQGVMESECEQMIRTFFRQKRSNNGN